jgi:hypothetical protein
MSEGGYFLGQGGGLDHGSIYSFPVGLFPQRLLDHGLDVEVAARTLRPTYCRKLRRVPLGVPIFIRPPKKPRRVDTRSWVKLPLQDPAGLPGPWLRM